jgi:hypothetical protein
MQWEASMDLVARPRLRVLMDQVALLEDNRESRRIAHPLPEWLLLVCGLIGAGVQFFARSSGGVSTTVHSCARIAKVESRTREKDNGTSAGHDDVSSRTRLPNTLAEAV